ncbi:MAG: ferredoxin reductase [Deltaproteobacteria bacterium]|nr:ferredoxin reductase [Deltaproteobacteria bacterium]
MTTPAMPTSAARTWRATATAVARGLFLDRQAEFWLGAVGSARSFRHVQARVIEVIAETPDVKTFVLAPNRRWPGHKAGQFATVEVELDGVRVRRCYSIASPPSARTLSITVKRVPGGRVSGWLHDHVKAGQVLRLGAPAGEFTLPDAPRPLLLLSGGSGITPVMSMLRELAATGAVDDVVFVHHARSATDVPFRGELARLAARHPGLRLILRLDDEGGGFDEAALAAAVPDRARRATFVCGPTGLMDRVAAMWAQDGLADRLHQERFVVPAPRAASGPAARVQLSLARAARTVPASTDGSLLEQLERAGERPASGCRIGICHTCTCRKTSGTVVNLITGVESSAPDQDIQLCISAARSDLELAL